MAAEPIIPDSVLKALEPLTEAWLANLEARCAWSRDQVELWDLRLWRDPKSGEERVAIPILDSKGKVRNVRLFRPETDFYSTTNIWVEGLNRRSQGKARLWPNPRNWVAADKRPLWICASEAEALAVMSQTVDNNPEPPACAVTAKPGAWTYAFNSSIKGRDVILAWPHDKQHQEAAREAADKMQKAAASLLLVMWPQSITKGYMPADKGPGLLDWLTAGHSLDDLLHLAHEAGAGEWIKPPVPAEEGEGPVKPGPDRFFKMSAAGRWSFCPAYLSAELLSDLGLITDRESGISYRWNGKHYEPIILADIQRLALEKLGDEGDMAKANNAAQQAIAHSTLRPGEGMNIQKEMICLPNGMLELCSGRILDHDPKYRATYMLPWEFDPRRPLNCPRFKAFLWQTLSRAEVIAELQEFMGYCLWTDNRYERTCFLIGVAGSGKSTLLDVFQWLVGEENCSNVNLPDLDRPEMRATLASAALNVFDEADTPFFMTNWVNSISSGKRISARHLYNKPFEFRPRCKLIFAANDFPRTRGDVEAFMSRLFVIQFYRVFRDTPHQVPDLNLRLQEEMPGIFGFALCGLLRLLSRNGFTRSEATQEALTEYRSDLNPLEDFAQRHLTDAADKTTTGELWATKDEVYQRYLKWAEANGVKKPLISATLCKRLYRMPKLLPGLHADRRMEGSNRIPIIVGAGLVAESLYQS